MINSFKKPEILAPCGSYEILTAAINAGANACYFGGNKFGARAYATNFDLENSIKAIDYAHVHGALVYLTVNTLFKDNEIHELYDYILPYYEAGLDAVIVQDLGVFKLIREYFPDLNIHCSTQMNITSKYAAKTMKDLGATRIVTAREMSLSEISEIKKDVDIEIESFVHGAMCYSYSGRCLMSSLAGGRSGNRGRCAQPCRKAYQGEYILSMKDMCTLEDIPQLIEAGVDSLKIEGRMKNAYYVASAVDAYKEIVDDCLNGCFSIKKAEDLKFRLANIYNRGGFCNGYYFTKNGPDMISKKRPNNQGVMLGKVTYVKDGQVGVELYCDLYKQDVIEICLKDGDVIEITSGIDGKAKSQVALNAPKTKMIKVGSKVLRTRCNHIIDYIDEKIINNALKYELYGTFNAKVGEKMSLTIGRYVLGDYFEVTETCDIVQAAKGKETSDSDIRKKISQLGNTNYYFADLSFDIDSNAFIPASLIKRLRRGCIESLESKIINSFRRKSNTFVDKNPRLFVEEYNSHEFSEYNNLIVRVGVSSLTQLRVMQHYDFVDGVFISKTLYEASKRDGIINSILSKGIKIYIELPHIVKNDFDIQNYLSDEDVSGIYIRNIDGLCAYAEYADKHNVTNLTVICGDGLYGYNNYSRELIKEICPGISFELPRELNKDELRSIADYDNQIVGYEYQPVMLSAQCVMKNRKGCNKACEVLRLLDDKKNVFYSKSLCDECLNVIYNGVPYLVLEQLDKQCLRELGVLSIRINFTIEEEASVVEILDIMRYYISGQSVSDLVKRSGNTYTSGHFNRGVE